MTQGTLFYNYAVVALSVLFLLLLVQFVQKRSQLKQPVYLGIAIALWPLLMIDEWIKVLELQSLAMLLGSTDFIAVVVLTLCLKAMTPMVRLNPQPSMLIWLPAIICGLGQLPVFFVSTELKLLWFEASQVGRPLEYWPFYLPGLLSTFGVLFIGVLLAEEVHRYHFFLPSQAVDIRAYKLKRIGGMSGITVGIAFTSILLLCAVTFGFFSIPFWQSLYHLLMAIVCLALITCLVSPQRTSPCPLDYTRLQDNEAPSPALQATLDRAKLDMIETKAYKHRELTIAQFCEHSDIDPTTLALALQLDSFKTFRGFIYHYRLEYAKKILLRSDASIARVAKRLGLESEKFLSGVLPDYLSKTH